MESVCRYEAPVLQTRVAGMTFANPVGLAAGFDKNCKAVPFLSALGFGHIEVGSVTGQPQSGNPRPRIFRLPRDRALINRMGFPSDGADAVAKRFAALRSSDCKTAVLGINLGKSKVTPIDDALDDYKKSFQLLHPFGDYFVLNVSSPNTPELRKLQERNRLAQLFRGVQEVNISQKPVFVKVAPDLSWEELDQVLAVCEECQVAGVIATNTTFARDGLAHRIDEVGGLSGVPLQARSLEVIKHIYTSTGGSLPVIGVGGVSSSTDVLASLRAGASLVQIYTGFVYQGPLLVKQILRELVEYCVKEGISDIGHLTGSATGST